MAKRVSEKVEEITRATQSQIEKIKKQAEDDKERLHVQLNAQVPELVQKGVQDELLKAKEIERKQAIQFRYPDRINAVHDPDRKPGSDVPFSYLRRMAVIYPIARACINRRIRQITQLNWDITTIDEVEDEKGYEAQIGQVKQFFKQPMGHRTRMREMLTMMIDDILTVDAVSFEVQNTRGGEFLRLVPVDPTTIALRVTETGETPEPPEVAYDQIISGIKVAQFTTDEMIYDFMGNRTMSPYGLAPLESLILQTEAAIRGTLYNLNYFRENNVPEGFVMLPEEVAQTKELVEQWQMWFDALVAGDPRYTHRLKILPGGTTYTPAKKPEDMAFERFELWLLQQTCMVFDVQPQDIGITMNVNKASAGSQQDIGRERGLIPLGNFIKEILDDVIQNRMGFENLQWIWRDINPVDRKEEVELAEKEINMGALSVDEYRIEHGREPIGLLHYVKTGKGAVLVKDIISGKANEESQDENVSSEKENGNSQEKEDDEEEETADDKKKARLEMSEIKKWRECVYKDMKINRPVRKHFKAHYIDPETYALIQEGVAKLESRFQAKIFFDQFLDPEVKASMTLLNYASSLRKVEHESHVEH